MERPPLSSSLTAAEFASWYWLKSELIHFAREVGLGTSGSKPQLQIRIADHLAGSPPSRPSPMRATGPMPSTFTSDTVIGRGWRCNPTLGAFFRQAAGKGFRFNKAMRDFIHNQPGHTLAEAVACYRASLQSSIQSTIPHQLEYNRHFRAFFHQHPGATREEAIAAWWLKRNARKD